MTDKEKIDLLVVTLMRVEFLLEDPNALKLWWKDAQEAIRKAVEE